MYKIRFADKKGKIITTSISNKTDLTKICESEAKNAIICSQIGNPMPISLHNLIVEHNSKVNGE